MRARTETRLPLVLLVLCLLLAACGREAPAPAAPEATAAPSLSPLPHRMHAEGESLRVYVDGLLAARGWTEDGCVYVPLRAVSGLLGLEQSWSGEEESFELRVGGLQVRGERDKEYFSAGGRYLWAPEGWRIREGELCLPLGALCKLFSLEAARQEDGSLALSTEHAALLSAGADWYELNFPADDVYWLSHIIAAEARFEPLDGQIGVGNVVMNRVRDPRFPGDVFGVIYDTEHTIQFEPIALGGIREEPGEQAMIAACLVLEGADTVGDSLYFVNPASGSGWFDANLELVAVIGNHNFYAQPTN